MSIDLASPREPWWLDLPGGIRWHVRPLTTALMLAARQAVRQDDAGEAERIEGLLKALACEALIAWEGVVAAGEPAEPTPEAIGAVLDRWPVFEAFRDRYFAPSLLLDAEKND